jgi:hypothetical protein
MPTRPARLFALALLASLAACGGGGSSSSGSSTELSSNSTAQSVSAGGAALPTDGTEATAVAVAAAQAVIHAGSTTLTANVSVNCAYSGTAVYTVTGPAPTLTNAALDAGESFTIVFDQCKGTSGAAAVSGRMTLSVVSVSPTLVVDTTTVDLRVALPLRTVTQNGGSRFMQTVTASGGNTTTVNRWTSSGIRIDSLLNAGGTRRYDLSNVDYTRSIFAVNGVPVSGSCEGHSTFDAQLGFLSWFITLATLSPIIYDSAGIVVSGHWSIELPNDHLDLQVTPSSVTLRIDLGKNGHDDLVFFFSTGSFFGAAG